MNKGERTSLARYGVQPPVKADVMVDFFGFSEMVFPSAL